MATMPSNLRDLSDGELAEHRVAVLRETERRGRLEAAPQSVAEVALQYVEDGGDPATLVAVLTPPIGTDSEPTE